MRRMIEYDKVLKWLQEHVENMKNHGEYIDSVISAELAANYVKQMAEDSGAIEEERYLYDTGGSQLMASLSRIRDHADGMIKFANNGIKTCSKGTRSYFTGYSEAIIDFIAWMNNIAGKEDMYGIFTKEDESNGGK